ncbi:MAG TPA: hypothetical protein VHB25_08085 [Gemmatimonadaceae bacterium]|nr:hypothetical protein [Gemmatimonadaceae bacterium]
MASRIYATVAPLVALTTILACDAEAHALRVVRAPQIATPESSATPRKILRPKLDTVIAFATVPGIAAPSKLVATSYGYVIQNGVTELIGFGHNGSVLWRHQLADDGSGRISDVQLGLGDSVMIADGPAHRLFILDAAGHLAADVSTSRVGHIDCFTPRSDGSIIAVTSDSVAPVVRFDRHGGIISRSKFPWRPFAALNPLARQALVAQAPHEAMWAVAPSFGGVLLILDSAASHVTVGHFVEPISFPDVIVTTEGLNSSTKLGRVTDAADAATLYKNEILVLFGGSDTTLKHRIIDRFDLRTGTYRGSYELPGRARAVSAYADRVAVLTARGVIDLRP